MTTRFFTQALATDSTRGDASRSTNVGLVSFILKRLEHEYSHDGRLWATADAPRGAVFQFTLPI
jgi:signal transduction histidine kinase